MSGVRKSREKMRRMEMLDFVIIIIALLFCFVIVLFYGREVPKLTKLDDVFINRRTKKHK